MSKPKVSVIVLAAGAGERFGSLKQFLELRPGLRLVDLALMQARALADEVVLVLPRSVTWNGSAIDALAQGGATRLESVANALAKVSPDTDVVVVHDAAHPLVPPGLGARLVDAVARGADAAVPFLPVSDVIKRVDAGGGLTTIGRDGLGLAQAPQAFSYEALVKAHSNRSESAWEDSELVEKLGGRVVAVAGDASNIHVVTVKDLETVRRLFGTDAEQSC